MSVPYVSVHCRLKTWTQLQEAHWIVSEWCCWELLCGKRQMGRHQGAAARWRWGKLKSRVDMEKSRQGLRDMAQQQNTSVRGMVPFLSHKSCTVHTGLSSIVLPLENMSTCAICQPRPLWGKKSLFHSALTQCGSTFIWIHSVIGAYSLCCFWQDCKGLLHLTAQDPSNVGFKNEMRTGVGGIIATEFKFLSLALCSTLQNAVSAIRYHWCVSLLQALLLPHTWRVRAARWVPRLPSALLNTVGACRPFCRVGTARIMHVCSCPW